MLPVPRVAQAEQLLVEGCAVPADRGPGPGRSRGAGPRARGPGHGRNALLATLADMVQRCHAWKARASALLRKSLGTVDELDALLDEAMSLPLRLDEAVAALRSVRGDLATAHEGQAAEVGSAAVPDDGPGGERCASLVQLVGKDVVRAASAQLAIPGPVADALRLLVGGKRGPGQGRARGQGDRRGPRDSHRGGGPGRGASRGTTVASRGGHTALGKRPAPVPTALELRQAKAKAASAYIFDGPAKTLGGRRARAKETATSGDQDGGVEAAATTRGGGPERKRPADQLAENLRDPKRGAGDGGRLADGELRGESAVWTQGAGGGALDPEARGGANAGHGGADRAAPALAATSAA